MEKNFVSNKSQKIIIFNDEFTLSVSFVFMSSYPQVNNSKSIISHKYWSQ